jgi:hypothetical protein
MIAVLNLQKRDVIKVWENPCLENPSFSDHFKRRSENMKHAFGSNQDITPILVVN